MVWTRRLLYGLLLLSLLSCSMPFMERAAISPGISGGVGCQVTGGVSSNIWGDPPITALNVNAVGYVCWANTPRASLSLTAFGGPEFDWGMSPTWPSESWFGRSWWVGGILGGKCQVGEHGALKLNLGAGYNRQSDVLGHFYVFRDILPLCWVSYMHDIGDRMTLGVNVGFPATLGFGITFHRNLSRNVILHAGATHGFVSSGTGGLGLEFVPSDWD